MSTSQQANKEAIIQQVAAVPVGEVTSYGAIAKAAGLPGYARFVGHVLRNLPKDSKLPWHRVINAQGKLSFPPESDAYIEQKKRLVNEGVTFKNDKVKLSHR